MIHKVLSIIAQQLNHHLQNNLGSREAMVSLSNPTGANEQPEENRMLLTLINVQQEQVKANLSPRAGFNRSLPPLNLNLNVLFTAHFKDYASSLKLLSSTLRFFQASQFSHHKNTPELNNYAERVSVEILNLDNQDLSSLWAMLGTSYQPSVVYKFRILGADKKLINQIQDITTLSRTTPS